MTAAVALEGISKRYGRTEVLHDVSLTCAAGRVHALVGENGAGKSTLLKILTGGVAPDAGFLSLDGQPVPFEGFDPVSARSRRIAIVHQEFALLPNLDIAQNIFLGHELGSALHVNRRAQYELSAELLRRIGSSLDPRTSVAGLSVADAQLVEIAKALAVDSRVLALDEPSAVLSGRELQTLFEIIRSLRQDGVAIIYVSHRMDELFEICDDYTVLKDGSVAGTGRIADTGRDALIRMMVGRDVSSAFPPRRTTIGADLLAVEDLQVSGLPAPVSLTVRAGEVVGIAGLGGSGRSRLLRGIFGLEPATGNVRLEGRSWNSGSARASIASGMALLPEDRKHQGLALTQSVASNITLLSLDRLRRGPFLSPHRESNVTAELVSDFGVKATSAGREPVGALSGGNQQKVVLAKWLQMSPRLVLLDEPTRGIDVAAKDDVYRTVRTLADSGVGFLLVSSELIEVLGLSDRVLVMADGKIVGEVAGGSAEEDVMRLITETSSMPLEDAS